MNTRAVQVPVSLLLDPVLSPSAKLIWMVMRLQRDGGETRPALLEARSGLSRKTVIKGLAQLAVTGWLAAAAGVPAGATHPSPSGPTIHYPCDLLVDRRVGLQGRLLFGLLQLTPGFRDPDGQFTYAGLSGLAGTSLPTVRRAVEELARAGWLRTARKHQLAPIHFSLDHPGVARGEAEVARARRRLEEAPFYGEALMREYLSLLVDSDQFEDNAAPGFLVNPWTDERMELDRFYPPGVAFEFNGPQHYGATDRFSAEAAARQRGRDYMKLGICVTRGIKLVVIHAADLSLETMRQKVGQVLPLRDLTGHEQLVAFLESVSRRYRLAARRKQASAGEPRL